MSAQDKGLFIKALAQFLAGDSARKSIQLQMGNEWAIEWARVRQCTPLQGWVNEAEAETALREWLLGRPLITGV